MFKKGDVNGYEVSMCIRRVASITSLKAGMTKEDSLYGKLIVVRSEYVDKTSVFENTQRETKKGLIRKEKRMRNLITQYRRGHAIDQIAGS